MYYFKKGIKIITYCYEGGNGEIKKISVESFKKDFNHLLGDDEFIKESSISKIKEISKITKQKHARENQRVTEKTIKMCQFLDDYHRNIGCSTDTNVIGKTIRPILKSEKNTVYRNELKYITAQYRKLSKLKHIDLFINQIPFMGFTIDYESLRFINDSIWLIDAKLNLADIIPSKQIEVKTLLDKAIQDNSFCINFIKTFSRKYKDTLLALGKSEKDILFLEIEIEIEDLPNENIRSTRL